MTRIVWYKVTIEAPSGTVEAALNHLKIKEFLYRSENSKGQAERFTDFWYSQRLKKKVL